jgi:hypothetical protein
MKRAVVLAFLAVLAIGREARAQQACADSTNLPNPVFMSVGETQISLVMALGKVLRETENITLIWRSAGSCPNLQSLYQNQPITTMLNYIPMGYDGVATPPQCSPGTAGVVPDVADSVVFVDACPLTKPTDVGDFVASVQPFAFVVPLGSSQHAITAEEAYFVFGYGAVAGRVTPWIDPMLTYILPSTKGTTLNLAAMISVPAAKWKGVSDPTLDQLSTDVAKSTSPDKTIGILGAGTYEEHRTTVRPLAFRAFKQYHAFYPNSTLTAIDKKPTRDGHYAAWSYTHWLARTDAQGQVINPLARRVIALITGQTVMPAPTFNPLDLEINAHFVPVCAMHVKRSFEGGDLSLFESPEPCDCYFDSKTGTPGPECSFCQDDSTCGAGKCRHNFCEPR